MALTNNNETTQTNARQTIELYFDWVQGTLEQEGETLNLDPIIARLLEWFISEPNQIHSRKELAENVWQSEVVSDDAVNRGISVLRKSLGGKRNDFITTIPRQGYRFVVPEHVTLHRVAQNPIEQTHHLATTGNASVLTRSGLGLGALVVVLVVVLVLFVWFYANTEPAPAQVPQAKGIAVLPFKVVEGDLTADAFVDGLRELILNDLTRIKGLLVMAKPDTNAQYYLQGSVRIQADKLRISAQLVDPKSGAYLFSDVIEGQMSDLFELQHQISEQVSAAFRLSFIHGEGAKQYLSSLSRLDHVSVEKLVIARSQVKQYKPLPVAKALKTLQDLNNRFADTPHVLGLLAYANAVYTSIATMDENYSRQIEIDLATQALALDPGQLDALLTLFHYYNDYANFRDEAEHFSQEILNHHPGNPTGYKLRFGLLTTGAASCNELHGFIDDLPESVYTPSRMASMRTVINRCDKVNTIAVEGEEQQAIDTVINNLGLNHDGVFRAINQLGKTNPNQRFLSQLHQQQLAMGGVTMAIETGAKIDYQASGYWSWLASMYGYLNDVKTQKLPSEFSGFVSNVYQNASEIYFSGAIVKQHLAGQLDKGVLTDYLKAVPTFKINLANRDFAMGLMVLQYHGNERHNSQQTAQKLLKRLNAYHQTNPKAFEFWSLGKAQFVSALYADKPGLAGQILRGSFAVDEAWWQHDKALMRSILAPWAALPVVIEYFERIDIDAKRARDEFEVY